MTSEIIGAGMIVRGEPDPALLDTSLVAVVLFQSRPRLPQEVVEVAPSSSHSFSAAPATGAL